MALAGLGCGGGGKDSDTGTAPATTSTALSKAEFLKKANAECTAERAGQGERSVAFRRHLSADGRLSPKENAKLMHFVLLPPVEEQMRMLYRLGLPEGEGPRLDAILTAERTVYDKLVLTEEIASMRAAREQFAESGKMFTAYGLPACSNGPR